MDLDYPVEKFEIIVVDSGSRDNTAGIAEDYLARLGEQNRPRIKILKEGERKGKASAITFGKKHAEGDIILVTDANSVFDKRVLAKIAPHFADPRVGAVGGRYCVANPENKIAASESVYWRLEYLMRKGESAIGSACLFHGEINAWRKDLVEADARMLSEDLDMCIEIRKKRYRIIYEPKAVVYEPSATTMEDQVKQRKRTSIGTIQNMFKHWKYLVLPGDLYRCLIFPSHKCLVMFSPFFLLAVPILYVWEMNPWTILTHAVLTLLVFLLLLALLVRIMSSAKCANEKSSLRIGSFPSIISYVFLNEYLILLAWRDFALGRYSVRWEKIESSR